MIGSLLITLALVTSAPTTASHSTLRVKVAAAVDAAVKNDIRGFAAIVDADAKLDDYKQPIVTASAEAVRQVFAGCTVQPNGIGEDPQDQVTQLWDCNGSPTLAAFNFKDGQFVLVRTMPNFRPISPPSKPERG